MKILYLCADPGIPVRGHKGASVHVRALCAALARGGHAVTLVAARPGPVDGPEPAARLIDASGVDDGAGPGPSAAARVLAVARALCERDAFDFIYERYALWSDAGAQLSASTGLPLALEVNAPLIEEARDHRGLDDEAGARAVAQRQFAAATRVAVVSESLSAYAREHGAQPGGIVVMPNGVDPIAFHPAVVGSHIRRRLGLRGRNVVGFVGRPRPWHDLATLVKAVERLHAENPAYALLLVGDMPEDVRALAAARPDLITLTGAVPHDSVPAHIAAMDVAVSSHHARDDFYFSPLKLFEYLACGVPTVAADVGQQADVVRETDGGLLYAAEDAAGLAHRIAEVMADPEAARAMAWRGATGTLARYTWDVNAAQVCAWFQPMPQTVETSVQRRAPLLDPRLRQRLYRASRADLVGHVIRQALTDTAARDLVVTDIDVLKYKPRRRAVLRYHLADAPWPTVIGKVFRDERAGRLAAIQKHLWEAGFGPDAADAIHVAEPIALLPELRAFLQAQAPGRTLNELHLDGADLGPLVERTAVGLAKLHSVVWDQHWTSLDVYTPDRESTSLGRYAADLTTARPDLGDDATALLASLQEWAGALPMPKRLRPVHRDFYYSQVLIDGPRLTLIDFDLICLGDAAIDVANFNAHLMFMGLDLGGTPEHLQMLTARFVDAYKDNRPPDAGFDSRVEFYTAATYFRLMNVVAGRPALAHLLGSLQRLTRQALAPA